MGRLKILETHKNQENNLEGHYAMLNLNQTRCMFCSSNIKLIIAKFEEITHI